MTFIPMKTAIRRFTNSVGNRIEIYVSTGASEATLCKTTMYGPDSSVEHYTTFDELEQLHSAIGEAIGKVDPVFIQASADAAGSMMLEMQQDCISLRVALAAARDQFKDYERQHRAKGTPDATAKAETNKGMAAMCQTAIGGSRRLTPSAEPEAGDAAAVVKTIEAARDGGMLSRYVTGKIADATAATTPVA